MRFALISLEEPANGADGSLRVAGRAIYRWQAEMALACGCERVLCWAPQEIAAPLALQKEVEGRGSRFQPVGDLHRLARIVGPGDELLVFSPGLMIEEDRLAGFVEDGHGIATIPAREGGEDGFDRIDLTRLAAGLMFLPGNLVARLADLPEDCEPGGSLLRIALQSGIPTRAVPESCEEANAYTIVRSEIDAKAIEAGWFERDWKRTSGPRNRLSRFVTDLIGKRAAHDERGPGLALGAVALGTLTTCALAIGGYAGGSLAALGVTALAGDTYRRLRALSRARSRKPRRRFAAWPGLFIDILLAGILVMALDGWREAPLDRVFLGVALVLSLRLADRDWGATLVDRPVVAAILGISTIFSALLPVTQVLMLACLALALHYGTRGDN